MNMEEVSRLIIIGSSWYIVELARTTKTTFFTHQSYRKNIILAMNKALFYTQVLPRFLLLVFLLLTILDPMVGKNILLFDCFPKLFDKRLERTTTSFAKIIFFHSWKVLPYFAVRPRFTPLAFWTSYNN